MDEITYKCPHCGCDEGLHVTATVNAKIYKNDTFYDVDADTDILWDHRSPMSCPNTDCGFIGMAGHFQSDEPDPKPARLAVILEGGIVQSVVSDTPEVFDCSLVAVIDYDCDTMDPEALMRVPQFEGDDGTAWAYGSVIHKATIDLDPVFTDIQKDGDQ